MLQETIPDLDALGLYDTKRLCPIFPGPAMIKGNHLTVRLPSGEVTIEAPKALFKRVYALCDGTRSIDELLATVASETERSQLQSFILFLLESGALIDASHYAWTATGYAIGNSPFGQAALNQRSDAIAKRFIPSAAPSTEPHAYAIAQTSFCRPFLNRSSTVTFGDDTVSLELINTMLWTMAGITGERRWSDGTTLPRRTISSAGAMHLLQVYVAIQAPLTPLTATDGQPDLLPGIYRVQYPAVSTVTFQKVSDDLTLLPRAVAKPWYLSGATGMIFLAADARLAGLRYRNRSVQYLFTEAGMALQNAALTAAEFGFGLVTFGSYYEPVVRQLCGLSDELVLGTAFFGSIPSEERRQLAATCPDVTFAWSDAPSDVYTLPYFVGRAQIKKDSVDRPTWGRDVNPALAWRKAIAETIERQGYREPRDLLQAAFNDLPHALAPSMLARFVPAQYRSKAFPFKPFDPNARVYWAQGTSHIAGKQVAILADFVYARESLETMYGYHASYWKSNSSGCAAGTTWDDAKLAALLELIERDAFMRHWLQQKPGVGVPLASLPARLQTRVNKLIQLGFAVTVQSLPSPWAPTAFFFAQHAQLRCTCVSAGARLRFVDALDSALVELESRVFSLIHGIALEKKAPQDIANPDDHFSLYAQPRYFQRADRLSLPQVMSTYENVVKTDLETPDALYRRFDAYGIDPVFVNITPQRAGVRDGREQLSVARAFAPGLVPMSFGYSVEPRGMIENVHRASFFPHPFP